MMQIKNGSAPTAEPVNQTPTQSILRISNLDAAHHYLTLGWGVLPLQPRDKRPALSSWLPFQQRHPYPTELEHWWQENPDYNVGVVTGYISGLVVLDVDGPEGRASLAGLHLPPTPIVTTGKGYHYYFRHPGGKVPNAVGLLDHVDLRGNGGYVVAPPSIHPNGQCYAWVNGFSPDDVELAPLPEWVLQKLSAGAKVPKDVLASPILEGCRNASLTSIAGSLRARGADEETILKVLRELNTTKCQPPLPEAELQAIVKSIGRYPASRNAVEIVEQKAGPIAADVPDINAGLQNLEIVTGQAIEALRMANAPPWLFLYGGVPVRVEEDPETKLSVAKELTQDRLRHVLARVANWYVEKRTKDGKVRYDAKPPLDVVRDVLAAPRLPFPVLARIVHAPVFGTNGEFYTQPGYHEPSKTYLALPAGFELPEVPAVPTENDLNEAKQLIVEELLGDFPLAADADRAHAVALLLLPFVRFMIDGPTPLHVIEAPSAGSGKSLLADVLLMPALGRRVGVIPPQRNDDELRKGITGRLREGASAILFDNVNSLGSPVLAAALTASIWDDRLLGKSETIRLPVQCAWVATANNAIVTTEAARRSIRIRLDPKMDRPWLRTGFRHPELRTWVAEHRAKLIWAAAVLVRSWLAAGKPKPMCRPLGSYEAWTNVVGGILRNAGIPGFLASMEDFYEVADTEGAVWRQFVTLWWDRFGDRRVTVAELFPLALASDFDLGHGSERSQKIVFGKRLARQRDRVLSSYRITFVGTTQRAASWQLTRAVNIVNESECSLTPAGFETKGLCESAGDVELKHTSTFTTFTCDVIAEPDEAMVPEYDLPVPEYDPPSSWEEDVFPAVLVVNGAS